MVKEGDEVEVKITDIDYDKKKVSLSIRALLDEAQRTDDGEDGAVVASADGESTEVAPDFEAEAEEAPATEE